MRRPVPSTAIVDRFVELFNAADKPGLLKLVLDNASVDNVGVGFQYGYDGHRSPKSWFDGALGGHPDWPVEWHFESQRAARAVYRGEPIGLMFRTRRGREALEGVFRLEQEGDCVSHLRSYSFCPETVREVGAELDLKVRTGPYRYPTPAPGKNYGDDAS